MKNITNYNKNFNYFIYSLIASSLILLLFCGLVIVDKNTRKIAFNDYSSIINFDIVKDSKHYFGIKIIGKIYTIDISFIYNIIQFTKSALKNIIYATKILLNFIQTKILIWSN